MNIFIQIRETRTSSDEQRAAREHGLPVFSAIHQNAVFAGFLGSSMVLIRPSMCNEDCLQHFVCNGLADFDEYSHKNDRNKV